MIWHRRAALNTPWNLHMLPSIAYYDPDFARKFDATRVDLIPSLDGSGDAARNQSQAVQAAMPTFTDNDAALAGHRGISFSGAQNMVSGAFSAAIAQPTTWYIVLKPASVASGFVYDGIGAGGRNALYFPAAGSLAGYAGSDVVVAAVAANDLLVVAVTYNGATSTTYKNGVLANTGSIGTSIPSGISLGSLYTGAAKYTGKIGHLSVHPAHDLATIVRASRYLIDKFKVT